MRGCRSASPRRRCLLARRPARAGDPRAVRTTPVRREDYDQMTRGCRSCWHPRPVDGGLPLLAALFLRPALGSLFSHCAYPPFHSWVLRGLSPHCSAAAVWHVGLRCRRPRVCGLTPARPGSAARRCRGRSGTREVRCKSGGGRRSGDTPAPFKRRLALLSALSRFLRAALCGFLRHYSSLEQAAQLLSGSRMVTTGGLSGPPSYEM